MSQKAGWHSPQSSAGLRMAAELYFPRSSIWIQVSAQYHVSWSWKRRFSRTEGFKGFLKLIFPIRSSTYLFSKDLFRAQPCAMHCPDAMDSLVRRKKKKLHLCPHNADILQDAVGINHTNKCKIPSLASVRKDRNIYCESRRCGWLTQFGG